MLTDRKKVPSFSELGWGTGGLGYDEAVMEAEAQSPGWGWLGVSVAS